MAKIGIDLGTTFSCVAIYRNNQCEVIANDHGNRTTPSIVSFTENERIVGEGAKLQMGINPNNTIYGIKRLIGRRFDDATVQEDIKRWPFEVVDDNNRPSIKIGSPNNYKYLHPEEISAMVLERMKDIAEKYLQDKVEGAVITVPAYFNDGQRKSTQQAAEVAKLNVLRIINEPTAAAMAYGLHNAFNNKQELLKVVVFDFGGGTLDVTVLVIEDGVFDVKATNGDTHLGGEDFDNELVKHCLADIKRRHKKDLKDNKKAIIKLKIHCEEAKKILSNNESTNIVVPALFGEDDYTVTISRGAFNNATEKLMERVMMPVHDALNAAHFDPSEINDVVLVGGSTKITKVQEALRQHFPKSKINMGLNPDEAVAMGAAIQAAKLGGTETSQELRDIVLMDVTPLSLGVQVAGGTMSIIIPRNTTVPVTKKKVFATFKDRQTIVEIKIFEGERPLTKDNHLLGDLKLTGITPAPVGVPQIEVSFKIDSDGVLNCTAVELREGSAPKEVRIQSKGGLLTNEDIQRMIKNAEQFRLQDELERERVNARLAIDDLCTRMASFMSSAENYGKDVNLRETVMTKCGEILSWLDSNKNLTKAEYEQKYNEIHDELDPIRRQLLNSKAEPCGEKDYEMKFDAVDD